MLKNVQDQAKACMDQNDWSGAIPLWQQVLESEPENTYAMGSLAFCHSRLKRHDEAIKLYERLCGLEPENARWPYTLGYQYYDQQDYRTALIYFDKSLSLNPNYIVVLYRKGYAQSQLGPGMRGQALTTFERCRTAYNKLSDNELKQREEKHYLDACYQQGKLFLEAGNYENAITRLKEVLAARPTDPDLLYSLGKACVDQKLYAEAVDYLEAALRIAQQPEHYILDRLAQAYAGLGNVQKAIQLYEQMPRGMCTQWAYISRNLGELYLRTEQWSKAEEILQVATRKDRTNHNGFYYLGKSFEQQGRWGEAARAFETAVKLRRERYQKEFSEAEVALQAIRRDHPDSSSKNITPQKNNPSRDIHISGRNVGRVKSFNSRGFGFLETDNGDLFFHISQVAGRGEVQIGESLEYEIGTGKDGRPAAVNLCVLS
jgi:tetratricopeptide (TPR) repeat protein/cold shock CspA family protein